MRQSGSWSDGDKYRQPAARAQTLAAVVGLGLLLLAAAPLGAQVSGPLVIFNAGSLAPPIRDLLAAFRKANPGVVPQQENSGSLAAARKVTELGKVPDVLAVADYRVLEQVIIPHHATWQVAFARNSMVLAFTARSREAARIDSTNWWRIMLLPGVRTGHSDPALDPGGYRALLVLQLAERHYGQPGLARRLDSVMPPRYQRPGEAELVALLQSGELDYGWVYRSVAETAGLRYVTLPPAINLADPARGEEYAHATVRVPAAPGQGRDSLEFRGEPILYALTIPAKAPNQAAAMAFVNFMFTTEGRAILERNGYEVLSTPIVSGTPPAGIQIPAGR